jgi:hypothetical protein
VKLSDLPPELSAVLRELGPNITSGAIYINDALVHGTPPTDPPGTVWLPAESVMRMQAYARAPEPEKPKMESKTATTARGKKRAS